MDFTINSLGLGEATDYKIESPVEGLETPPIRTSQDNYSGRDGGRVNGQFYSPRLITLTGFIGKGTCDLHEAARLALQQALPIREDLDMTISTFDGTEYATTVRLLDLKMPYINKKHSDFKIDLVAADPFLYSGDEFSAVIPLEVGGGFTLPVTLPIIFAPGTAPTVVTNGGNAIVYPTITIVGAATNPEITKVDTGEKVEVNVTMSGGDTLVIDLKRRVITLNGGSVLSLRSTDSSWWGLDVGANELKYETTNGGDTGVATITWRNATTAI